MSKVIVISGASKGLGRDIALSLSREPKFKIATISRSIETEENSFYLQFSGDISNANDVSEFYLKVISKWGKIDILINNAALIGEFKDLTAYNWEEMNQIIDINIKGTFMMTSCVLPLMSKEGYILNIGSTRSITGAPTKSLYTMTKFALRGLTQCINAEYNSSNIYSTIICPGKLDNIQKEVVDIIDYLINNNIRNIPEIIVGGKL